MDMAKNYYSIGEANLPLADEFHFTDDSDFEKQGQEYDKQDFLSELENGDYGFTGINTMVTIQDGYITDIHRIFVP